MSYKKPVIPVLEPQEGYDRLGKDYAQYHAHLNSFDKGSFMRMMPRSLEWLSILELGAGDGRVFSYLKNLPFKRFVATDSSEVLLKRHPGISWVEKIVCNMEEELPFQDQEFDLVLTFFVFEHITKLKELFERVDRILKPWGTRVVGHYLHRREYPFKDKQGDFKIRHEKWKFEQLEEYADRVFFDYSFLDVVEKGALLGRIYRFEKK